MRPGHCLLIALVIACPAVALGLGEKAKTESNKPAEESRLNVITFREALKKRGLTDLLELHLQDFPPRGANESLLTLRDVKLAEFADPGRSQRERLAAVAEANRLLEELIKLNPEDIRRFEWRFALAQSLIYQEAEVYFTPILYHGGTDADDRGLLSLTSRALAVLDTLRDQLRAEYARLDGLAVGSYENLERSGYVEQIDRLSPKTDYLLLWALFYNSLAREESDPARAANLNRIVHNLKENAALLLTPHESSHVQVPVLLLAGMTYRLLHDHSAARDHLDRALAAAERLNPAERERAQWTIPLALVERVRNDRDDARFDDALAGVIRLREFMDELPAENFPLRLAASLLEKSIWRARSTAADKSGRTAEADRCFEAAGKPMAQLLQRYPGRRDEIYARLYSLLKGEEEAGRLDPVERSALIAGWLFEAAQAPERAEALLTRAVTIGERFLGQNTAIKEEYIAEIAYNVAVAEHRLGRTADAARRFLRIAVEHPRFERSPEAAAFTVRLSSELLTHPSLERPSDAPTLYADGLRVLLAGFPDTQAARYWRFYYAQLLDDREQYEQAAIEYGLVDSGHEHYLDALFFRLRCLAKLVEGQPAATVGDSAVARNRSEDFFTGHREFASHMMNELAAASAAQADRLRKLTCGAQLLAAEVQLMPAMDRPAAALETLADFEERYPDASTMSGRVWRVRLLAYQKLGRLQEAARAIPEYIAADPQGAGPTLQSLYLAISGEFRKFRADGDEKSASMRADAALVLAEQIRDWAKRDGHAGSFADERTLQVQLAEACLNAGQFHRAVELFEPYMPSQGASTQPVLQDARILFGYAESLFQLREWAKALPVFNRLAVGLPADDPMRWTSLLHDLQCRTALKEPPRNILKVIAQQRYLHPDLGGPAIAPQLEKIERENQRRLDGG